jgi:hypothetical protein
MTNTLLKSIAVAVSEYQGVDIETMFSAKRDRKLADLRSIFHYLGKKYTSCSLAYIGAVALEYGREKPHDHSTVLHSCKKVKRLASVDKEFGRQLNMIEGHIRNHVLTADAAKSEIYGAFQDIMNSSAIDDDVLYLETMSRVLRMISETTNKGELTKLLAYYEGIHQAAPADNGLGVVSRP